MCSRFRKDPIGFIRRGFCKRIIGPVRYGKGDDYDALRYWHDRFSKHGVSLRGAGDEGLSLRENKEMYENASKVFVDLCRKEHVNFNELRVLEIGCGTGFYTNVLHGLGVRNYLGIDITDVLFPDLKREFPQFRFLKRDITTKMIEESFDLIIMIDVIEHIVSEAKLDFAMENVKKSLSAKGVFIVAPIITDVGKRHLFYLRSWSLNDLSKRFSGYVVGELIPFRGSGITTIKRPVST